jgi:hypothetical protein
VIGLLGRDDRGIARQHEVNAWVRYKVGLEFCDVAFIRFLTYTHSVVIANQCQMPDARPPQWKGRKASFGARLAPSVNKVHVIAHS